jgi:hypothetical protein
MMPLGDAVRAWRSVVCASRRREERKFADRQREKLLRQAERMLADAAGQAVDATCLWHLAVLPSNCSHYGAAVTGEDDFLYCHVCKLPDFLW